MEEKQSLELLCVTSNGKEVYYDPLHSHASTHFSDSPNLKQLVEQVLEVSSLHEQKEIIEHTFDEVIGTTDLIKTAEGDHIVYGKRLNRDNYTRFVMEKSPVDSSDITIILYKHNDSYVLYSAYIGRLVPSFPMSPAATEESIPFWKDHALVWGTQEVLPQTLTSDSPW